MRPEKNFEYGETRWVFLDIVLDNVPVTVPQTASWELTEYRSGLVESSGECTIRGIEGGYSLAALVSPQHVGLYRVIFTFSVKDEVRRPCMIIKVR